ncbi:MAG: DUF58 domain-containing protein [Spirulina sp.]
MAFFRRLSNFLEQRGLQPTYAGGLLLGLAIFLFAAATNTLAGWLYVMSGLMLALLAMATRLPRRQLHGVTVERMPIEPVAAGENLAVTVLVHNSHRHAKGLFQVIDAVHPVLGTPQRTALRHLDSGQTLPWRYWVPTTRRGIYTWETLTLRSAAPLGLFWYRRTLPLPTTAIVYPQILPLAHCPIVDALGNQSGQQWHYHPVVKPATEGVTRSLRPYRWGDPTRLIHWRTSARYGELRVRELEKVTASQEIVIALNTRGDWAEESFEQAVIAAASLYHYALGKGFAAALWLPSGELLQDRPGVLMALAGVAVEATAAPPLHWPEVPTVWLTSDQTVAHTLAPGSRQIVWRSGASFGADSMAGTGAVLWIDPNDALQMQLQQAAATSSPQSVSEDMAQKFSLSPIAATPNTLL